MEIHFIIISKVYLVTLAFPKVKTVITTFDADITIFGVYSINSYCFFQSDQ